MKVLLAPFHTRSHQIPLLVMYEKYLKNLKDISCTFMLPISQHKYCQEHNITVLDFDNTPPRLMMEKEIIDINKIPFFLEKKKERIRNFAPDVVIEDSCFDTAEFCELNNIPRISIQRTGIFRTSDPATRNSLHVHSLEKELIRIRGVKVFLYEKYCPELGDFEKQGLFFAKYNIDPELKNILNPKVKIIPGISEIETLPEFLDQKSYYYSGPLIQEDENNSIVISKIKDFLNKNYNRRKVFLTMGLVENLNLTEIFQFLTKKGYAIITSVYPPYGIDKRRIFYNSFLPLHYISESVDIIIHQCGSGIYHYPLLHLKPSITLGTQCYDREDVALKLNELKLSVHIPSPYDDSDFMEKFIFNIDRFEAGNMCNYSSLKMAKEKILETMNSFNMRNILASI